MGYRENDRRSTIVITSMKKSPIETNRSIGNRARKLTVDRFRRVSIDPYTWHRSQPWSCRAFTIDFYPIESILVYVIVEPSNRSPYPTPHREIVVRQLRNSPFDLVKRTDSIEAEIKREKKGIKNIFHRDESFKTTESSLRHRRHHLETPAAIVRPSLGEICWTLAETGYSLFSLKN